MSDAWWDAEDAESEAIADGLAAILGSRGLNVPPEVLERHVTSLFSRLSPADSDNFMNALKDVGQSVGKFATSKEVRGVAGVALPIAGTAVGTMFGGPLGAAVGGSLGGAAGQAIAGGGPSSRAPQAPVAPSGAVLQSAIQGAATAAAPALGITPPQTGPAAGSTAAAQLLSVIQNPALLSSLLALTMGSHGVTSVPIGGSGTQVPVGAMMNLIATLANRATDDADAITAAEQEATPDYLLDEHGCPTCDPAVASQRADALLRVLNAEAELAAQVEAGSSDAWFESDNWSEPHW